MFTILLQYLHKFRMVLQLSCNFFRIRSLDNASFQQFDAKFQHIRSFPTLDTNALRRGARSNKTTMDLSIPTEIKQRGRSIMTFNLTRACEGINTPSHLRQSYAVFLITQWQNTLGFFTNLSFSMLIAAQYDLCFSCIGLKHYQASTKASSSTHIP